MGLICRIMPYLQFGIAMVVGFGVGSCFEIGDRRLRGILYGP